MRRSSIQTASGAMIALCLSVTSGCANSSSLFRKFYITNAIWKESDSISIDAKQRVVVTGKHRTTEQYYNEKNEPKTNVYEIPVVCAEPSPDAISSFAQSLSGKVDVKDYVTAQAVLSQTESTAYVGLRTQTVQMLRDGMYRICEAYLSKALDKSSYEELQRRYQSMMLGLLAVEQLTGAVVAPQVALSSAIAKASTAAGADSLLIKQEAYETAKSKRLHAENDLEAANKALKVQKDKNSTDQKEVDKLAELQKDVDGKSEKLEIAKNVEQEMKKKLESVDPGVAAAANGAIATLQTIASTRSSADFSVISKSVHNIVQLIVDKTFRAEDCMWLLKRYLADNSNDNSKHSELFNIMKGRCDSEVNKANAETKKTNDLTAAVKETTERISSSYKELDEAEEQNLAASVKLSGGKFKRPSSVQAIPPQSAVVDQLKARIQSDRDTLKNLLDKL